MQTYETDILNVDRLILMDGLWFLVWLPQNLACLPRTHSYQNSCMLDPHSQSQIPTQTGLCAIVSDGSVRKGDHTEQATTIIWDLIQCLGLVGW